ncbi:hypothetical protein [Streptomyces sp. F-7]|uniref:hypothetical protein n=1 Tax=Streptomyces sp. F-7 TaxID=573566 RepID=UPI000AE9B642|nr:hypothetical protein [Streptomyces sp. F-7]
MPFMIQVSKAEQEQSALVGVHAHLSDISILELHGKVLDPEAAEELAPINELNSSVAVGLTEDSLMYRFKHEFTVKGKGDKDAVYLCIEVGAAFDVSSAGNAEEAFSVEAVNAFGRTTAVAAIYPYLRASISDLTGRLGCSHMTMDLLILGEDRED